MNGRVDAQGRTLLGLRVKNPLTQATALWETWIDTGFTGELVVPLGLIAGLGLHASGSIGAILADGSTTLLQRFDCLLDWFGTEKRIEVIASHGATPLLGYGLLLDRKLTIDYPALTLTLQ